MTEHPRRRRPHPAKATRVLVAGAAAAGTLGMVAAMANPFIGTASTPASVAPATLTSAGGTTSQPAAAVQPADRPTRIVVIRRHHPVDARRPTLTGTPATGTSRVVPAPVRPAHRAAPVVTKSRGS